jgi:predicted metal-dependent phosphoesterase TrpH
VSDGKQSKSPSLTSYIHPTPILSMIKYQNYLRTEFHCHTIYSKDCLTTPKKLIDTCKRKGIDRVIVTDHNSIEGALHCKEIDPERVIIGEEIMTTEGELLAAYLLEEVPPGLPPQEAINRLREQKAFISVSHPFDKFRNGHWDEANLLRILPYVDAIETFNSRCMLPRFNFQAQDFAAAHHILGTYGSDAHAAFELGRGTLLLPHYDDAQSLKSALKSAIFPKIILGTPLVHFTSRWAVWIKRLRGR